MSDEKNWKIVLLEQDPPLFWHIAALLDAAREGAKQEHARLRAYLGETYTDAEVEARIGPEPKW